LVGSDHFRLAAFDFEAPARQERGRGRIVTPADAEPGDTGSIAASTRTNRARERIVLKPTRAGSRRNRETASPDRMW
jgi:hypothetical protein